MKIDFSDGLKIPSSVCTQKLAFLGISGSGKTYGASKLVEGVIKSGAQVVVVDVIGNWYGLRLAADGKSPGIAIPILGGAKGDVPLDSYGGRQAAELVVDSNASIILDVSDFTGGEMRRFVIDFATHLLALKKRNPSPTLVVWEECQDIVPQRVIGEMAKVVGAVEKLIKKGRNYGVGTVLISQRPQAVNKDVLNQIETLFVFRLNAAQDRKAILDWIVQAGIDVGKLVDTLPTLATGSCYCWSPQFLKVLEKIKVGKKETFDASATPEFGGPAAKAGVLAPVDLERFKKTMADAVAKAKENDPAELRKRVAELEKQLRAASSAAPPPPVVQAVDPTRLIAALRTAREGVESAQAEAAKIETLWLEAGRPPPPRTNGHNMSAVIEYKTTPGIPPGHHRVYVESVRTKGDDKIGGGARKMLQILAMRQSAVTTRVQLATLAGFSHKSGTYATYLAQLNVAGFIAKNMLGEFAITVDGLRHLQGDYPGVPPTSQAMVELWCDRLDGRAKEMLKCLAKAGPQGLTRDQIATHTDLSTTSGTFATYLAKLNANGLIEKHGRQIVAAEEFWL